jgi:hypothetical protein
MDNVMVFGFVTGFFTVVGLIYRRELRSTLPALAILLSASALYGFLQGAWPLGCVLLVMTGSEVSQWWRGDETSEPLHHPRPHRHFVSLQKPEARMTKLFGRG